MILSSVLLANALVNGVSKTITNVGKAAVGNACCAADVNIGIPTVIAACAGSFINGSPEELRTKVKELHERWNEVKDSISETDKIELAKEINDSLAVNEAKVVDKDNVDAIDWNSSADKVLSASEVSDDGLLESVGDFLCDLF